MAPNRTLAYPVVLFLSVAVACRDDVSRVTAPGSPALLADNVGAAAVTQRPIEDFINAQSNVIGWTAPQQTTGARGDDLFMLMDYAGIRAQQILAGGGPDLGTTFSGRVTERPLPDGTAEVHVVLHTHNAFAIGRDLISFTVLFGHTTGEIIGGADAAVGDCDLAFTFINTAPGAPLPDIATTAVDFKDLFFRGSADGTLRAAFGVPDGTPGRGHVVQNGLFQASGKGATADGFPAELITFKVVGN
jgi:hypothetical protein